MASSFEKLQEALSDLSFDVRGAEVQSEVEVEGGSIEECLEKAAETLDVNISDLEYEIIDHGRKSLLKKKPYRLLVKLAEGYDVYDAEVSARRAESEESDALRRDADGTFRVKITRIGVMLRVNPPRGKGNRVRVEDVLRVISTKGITEFDKSKVAKIIRDASGEYVRIGDWTSDERNDSRVVAEVSEDEMKAFMTVIPPKPKGRDLDIDDVLEALNDLGVTVGIKQDVITGSLEDEVYSVPILIAEGRKPQNGEDAKISYNFRLEKKVRLQEDEKGQVNFKDLDLVENVVAGQLLATKTPATEGKEGRTITNRILPAKNGNDVPLNPGKNTELSPDGMSVIAAINGQVVLFNNKINVEPIYEVKGDVDIHTGNILFLGTVIVKGNVEDGFSIKAAGDIEIMGSVGKCLLDAEGDIHIKQGCMGKLGGNIKSGGSVWAKFLEQINVTAGKNVFVQDGIMHCQVDATEKVVCFGKRATIVGGRIRAGEIVNTKTLGSVSFTETVIEVGVDPKSRQRLFDVEKEKAEVDSSLEKLNANINTLNNQKKTGRNFTEEKEELLGKMLASKNELDIRLNEINEEMNELRSYLKLLKTIGKVSVSKNVYPGARIAIKDIYYDVTNEFKYVTFILDSGRIRIRKYETVNLEELIGKRLR
jgi:uncharacterized protein (DUF342 family)